MSSNSVSSHLSHSPDSYPPLKPQLTPLQPIPPTRLQQITTDACDSALANTNSYEHSQTQAWNESIVNKTLQALISESAPTTTGESNPAGKWKFIVNSTIIQHLSDSGSRSGQTDEEVNLAAGAGGLGGEELAAAAGAGGERKAVGRRGMHSASGAYWNNERDGMWSWKYTGAEAKGMDVVVNVVWIAA
ncbi:hypothetical protein MBLNU230_g8174t1 [Neophaeotheca triangularis]